MRGWAAGCDGDARAVAGIYGRTCAAPGPSRAAIDAGKPGLIFPSVANPGGTNVVLFPTALAGVGTITVHDPDGRLPKNQSSWM